VTRLHVIDLETGHANDPVPIWASPVEPKRGGRHPPPYPLAARGDRLIIATGTGAVIAYEVGSRRTIWAAPFDRSKSSKKVTSPPVILKGQVFVLASGGENLRAFDLSTGAYQDIATPRGFKPRRIVPGGAGGIILLDWNRVLRVDASTAEAHEIARVATKRLVVAGNEFLIPDRNGISAYDLSHGRMSRTIPWPAGFKGAKNTIIVPLRDSCALMSGSQLAIWSP